MRRFGVLLLLSFFSACSLDAIDEQPRRGPLDGAWSGVAADGARFELFIDQTQKVSHGDGLVGDGTVTWTDRDGERTDPLLVQGQGEAQFVFELQRGISGSYSQPVGTIYFSATLDEAHAAATGVLSGDDHYGLRFDSEALVLFR
jgi:hypothetical protein